MSRQILLSLIVGLAMVANALAQVSPGAAPATYLSSTEKDAAKLVADRERFVRENYTPDPTAMAGIQSSLNDAAKLQDKYLFDVSLTLSRMSLAMGIAAESNEYTAEKRNEVLGRLRQQAARIYAIGPLSLAKVAKMAEGRLSADRISAGRAKLTARLSTQLGSAAFDVEKLDALLTPPLGLTAKPVIPRTEPIANPVDPSRSLSMEQVAQTITKANEKPANVEKTTSERTIRTKLDPMASNSPNVVQNTAKVAPTPPPPPPPQPRNLPPAPSTNTWADVAKASTEKYKYSTDQQKIAETILQGVLQRAAKAGDTKDSAGNRVIDMLYDELNQRLNSVATIEQRQAAQPPAPKPAGN